MKFFDPACGCGNFLIIHIVERSTGALTPPDSLIVVLSYCMLVSTRRLDSSLEGSLEQAHTIKLIFLCHAFSQLPILREG